MTEVRASAPDEQTPAVQAPPHYDLAELIPRLLHAAEALRRGDRVDELDLRLLLRATSNLLIAVAERTVGPATRRPGPTRRQRPDRRRRHPSRRSQVALPS